MINRFSFNEVQKPFNTRVSECELGKAAENFKGELPGLRDIPRYDRSLAIVNVDIRNCPLENGHWEGERGNSKWVPDEEYVPQKANKEGKTWGEIMEQYDIDGIEFIDGEPNFENISKGDVQIDGFSDKRDDNFDKADVKLAEQRGCSPEEVRQWRKDNGYTWHECKDMETMQKVPSVIHNNVSHRGGISNTKSLDS